MNTLTIRQEKILEVIVKEYVSTAQPVGSKKIMDLMGSTCSSATIRNEASHLEELEFLEKQHTSSGRVPSTKGYRYYVDNILKFEDDIILKKRLTSLITTRNITIDEVIDQASEIIAEMTKMTVVVSKAEQETQVVLKGIELIPLSDDVASVIFALSDGTIQKKVFHLDSTTISDLRISIKYFSRHLLDSKINLIQNKSDLIKQDLKMHVKNYEYIIQTFVSTILQNKIEKQEMHGIKYMLENPEFNDTNKLKKAIWVIENISAFDLYDIDNKSNEMKNAIYLKIGNEIVEDDNMVFVGTKIKTPTASTSITFVGPKRTDYDKTNTLVSWLIELINSKERDG